jgi:hypothetical protein
MEGAMNSDRQFATVAAAQVQNCIARYPEYHADLVSLLVEVVNLQAAGRSSESRRTEVQTAVKLFGEIVMRKGEE